MKQAQVAAWVPDMFSNFYSEKNNKIGHNSTTTKATEKINTLFGVLRILKFFWCMFGLT